MLNPRQLANVLNENIREGILYSEKSVQKAIWKLLKKRFLFDVLQNIITDTCWSSDQDTKYPWKLYTLDQFKGMYKNSIVELPTPGEKLNKKEINVVDTFVQMYTARVIPLLPLEPSGHNNEENNLKSDDPINTNAISLSSNLTSTTTPTTTPTTGPRMYTDSKRTF